MRGLRPNELLVLNSVRDGFTSQKELIRVTKLSARSIKKLVASLVRKELLIERFDPFDLRNKHYEVEK